MLCTWSFSNKPSILDTRKAYLRDRQLSTSYSCLFAPAGGVQNEDSLEGCLAEGEQGGQQGDQLLLLEGWVTEVQELQQLVGVWKQGLTDCKSAPIMENAAYKKTPV